MFDMHVQSLIVSLLVPILLLLCPSPLSLVSPYSSMNSLLSSFRSIARSRLTLPNTSLLGRSTMTTFTLPSTFTTVHLTSDLTQSQLLEFRPFNDWLSKLQHSLSLQSQNTKHPFHTDPYLLHSITIQSVDFFGGSRIGFLKLKADIKSASGASLPGSVFLRGGSVAILLVLETKSKGQNERWAVLTVQPRIPAGSLEMVELPAGMIDDSGTFAGAAAKEIQEECGIEIAEDKLIDLTSKALGSLAAAEDERLEEAVYPSPGGSDEFMKIYAYVHRVEEGTLDEWKGKLTGLRDEGEKITLKLVRLEDLWRETRDSKALSAMALWTGLKM